VRVPVTKYSHQKSGTRIRKPLNATVTGANFFDVVCQTQYTMLFNDVLDCCRCQSITFCAS